MGSLNCDPGSLRFVPQNPAVHDAPAAMRCVQALTV